MPPVPLKFVVSFSSQDERHSAENLLCGNGFKRWLSGPGERSGQIEAVFQLDHPCTITHIDLGSVWCANIEVQVGRSSWPQSVPYKTLVPAVSLMSPIESRNGNSVTKTRMFNSSDFMEDACGEEWDRIRVLCGQPYRKDVQFGLSFLRVKGQGRENNSVTESSCYKDRNCSIEPVDSRPSPRVSLFKERLNKQINSHSKSSDLEQRLLTIAGTAENGTGGHGSLSRTAKLVLAAAGQSPNVQKSSASPGHQRSLLNSNSVDTRADPSFEGEVKRFLSRLQLKQEDLSGITVADLRHRLERKKRRKLTREEKKEFLQLTREYLQSRFEEQESQEVILVEVENAPSSRSLSVLDSDSESEENFKEKELKNKLLKLGKVPSQEITIKEDGDILQTPKSSQREITRNSENPVTEYCLSDEDLPDLIPNGKNKLEMFEVTSDTAEVSGVTSHSEKRKSGMPNFDRLDKRLSTPKAGMPNFDRLDKRLSTPKAGMPHFDRLGKRLNTPKSCMPNFDRLGKRLSTPKSGMPNFDRLGKRLSTPKSVEYTSRNSLNTSDMSISGTKSARRSCKSAKKTRAKKMLETGEVTMESSPSIAVLCTDCHKMVPEANFLVHQARCKYIPGSVRREIDRTENSQPPVQGREPLDSDWTATDTDIEICDLSDTKTCKMVTCPICQQDFPSEQINVHANACAEMSLLV